MKIVLITLIAVAIAAAAVFAILKVVGSSAPTPQNISEGDMLFDYYKRIVALETDGAYTEGVLSYLSSDAVYLDHYDCDGKTETRKRYKLPYEAYKKCLDIAKKYNMSEWNDHDYPGITGAVHVCKIRMDGGEYLRVSSESMPENGMGAFREIDGVFAEYMMDKYFISREQREVARADGTALSPGNIVEVSFGRSGDDIGSSEDTRLYLSDDGWMIEHAVCSGNGYETETETTPVDDALIEKIRGILAEYDWGAMPDLPQSDEFALDAPVSRLCFRFDPFDTWCITSDQNLSDEACEMWKRIENAIKEYM